MTTVENIILIVGVLFVGMFFGAVVFNQINKTIYGEYFYKTQKIFCIVGIIVGAVASAELLNIMYSL